VRGGGLKNMALGAVFRGKKLTGNCAGCLRVGGWQNKILGKEQGTLGRRRS